MQALTNLDHSSDNSESDLDGECPAEPVNTGLANPRLIKDNHRIYDQSRYENIYFWHYYSQSYHGYMCKICKIYYGSFTMFNKVEIVELGPINQSPSMAMSVKSYGATIPQKVIIWQISTSKIPSVHGQKKTTTKATRSHQFIHWKIDTSC